MATLDQKILYRLLQTIRTHFYTDEQNQPYYRDRRRLLYALTWPATWMQQRGLRPSPKRYEQLITARLHDIATHGNPASYQPYFPRYLLKCLQQWFLRHGDTLYEELKHIRNELYEIEKLIEVMETKATENTPQNNPTIAVMAHTHALLKSQNRRTKDKPEARQLTLF